MIILYVLLALVYFVSIVFTLRVVVKYSIIVQECSTLEILIAFLPVINLIASLSSDLRHYEPQKKTLY